mmetsp:Transcript_24712/g.58014  ORF Transcript_24712/g.58014 Transcript_24712/m.58014 type:complete len:282 (-) Transcript_24712:482-1327(-)
MLTMRYHQLILQIVASFVADVGGFPFPYHSHPLNSFHAIPLDSYHQNYTFRPYHRLHHFVIASSWTFGRFRRNHQNYHSPAVAEVVVAAAGVVAADTDSSSALSLEFHSTNSCDEVSTSHNAGSGSQKAPSEACSKAHHPYHPNLILLMSAVVLLVSEHNDHPVQLQMLLQRHLQHMVCAAALPHFRRLNLMMDQESRGSSYDDSCHHSTLKVLTKNFDVVSLNCPNRSQNPCQGYPFCSAYWVGEQQLKTSLKIGYHPRHQPFFLASHSQHVLQDVLVPA